MSLRCNCCIIKLLTVTTTKLFNWFTDVLLFRILLQKWTVIHKCKDAMKRLHAYFQSNLLLLNLQVCKFTQTGINLYWNIFRIQEQKLNFFVQLYYNIAMDMSELRKHNNILPFILPCLCKLYMTPIFIMTEPPCMKN